MFPESTPRRPDTFTTPFPGLQSCRDNLKPFPPPQTVAKKLIQSFHSWFHIENYLYVLRSCFKCFISRKCHSFYLYWSQRGLTLHFISFINSNAMLQQEADKVDWLLSEKQMLSGWLLVGVISFISPPAGPSALSPSGIQYQKWCRVHQK